jgi:hypothetical protein
MSHHNELSATSLSENADCDVDGSEPLPPLGPRTYIDITVMLDEDEMPLVVHGGLNPTTGNTLYGTRVHNCAGALGHIKFVQ